jgi:tellurite methyltransferase
MPGQKSYSPSRFLVRHQDLVLRAARHGPVLDLACGSGRNGLYLAWKGAEVHFWDRNQEELDRIENLSAGDGLRVETKRVDLESEPLEPLPAEYFGAVLVFRYLHRPLIPAIKAMIRSRGLIVYETFTREQAALGKPENPDFLLNPGELFQWFKDWEVLDHHQGLLENPERYMAGIVARKT